MNQVLSHGKRGSEFAALFHGVLRSVVVLNWVVILLAVLVRSVPKALALDAFAVFKVCAIFVGAVVMTEIFFWGRHSNVRAVLLDAVLGLSMFLFWFFVLASTF